MNKKTLGWIAGIGSYIGVIFLFSLKYFDIAARFAFISLLRNSHL